MRASALSATVAMVAATLAGGAAPAAAAPAGTLPPIDLEAGTAALHHNTARVTYERVDGAANTFRIITVEAFSGRRDCIWVEWNDPDGWNNGWSRLHSEPPCDGGNLLERPDRIITAPKDHPIKVRLVAYHHDNAVDIVHKDVAKL
ncbi:hypothetical protein ACFVGY_06180 [Streptomyces sp. NPDC127106]|uniref:hypothetical protein n=1 Tax=Streptomyces sp. NPDC127106 TaxID=3345360 RepID=UPI00363D9B3F